MKIGIIGGTGHIGCHLVPMLTCQGHHVTVIARGQTTIPSGDGWKAVSFVDADYRPGDQAWPVKLKKLGQTDALVDLLGTDLESTYNAVKESCNHVIACGSVWMLGTPQRVPYSEQYQSVIWDAGYRQRWDTIQRVLHGSISGGPRFTAILPPNICGPGKIPLDTRGGRSIAVHRELAKGARVYLPEGPDVLIGPCDAQDIARGFMLAIEQPNRAGGYVFNVGSAYALTAMEFISTYAQIYKVPIPIERVSWSEFAKMTPDKGDRFHFEAHMCPDISAIRSRLDYKPEFTPEQTMLRAVEWMRAKRLLGNV